MKGLAAILALTFLSVGLRAQLRVGGDAGAGLLPVPEMALATSGDGPGIPIPRFPWMTYGTRAPSPPSLQAVMAQPAGFDYASVKPHLAFFCRLELRIEEETRIPVRFRLGEVRGWQQELTKRD